MGSKVLAKASEGERHLGDVTCLLYHKNKLYSGGDDGKIKVWSPDLKLLKEADAHPVNVYSLAASDTSLYSSSNDGTIKVWSLDNLEFQKNLLESNDEVLKLYFSGGKLYSGDDKGVVKVWENDEQIGSYEVGEEVYGLTVSENLLFTARYLDLSVIEMKTGGKQYTFLQSIQGRVPIEKVGKYICFVDREGKVLNTNEISKESKFKSIGSLEGHEMLVNAVTGSELPQPTVFTGGYDKVVKRWDIVSQKSTGNVPVDTIVNALAADDLGNVYVAGSCGFLIRVAFL